MTRGHLHELPFGERRRALVQGLPWEPHLEQDGEGWECCRAGPRGLRCKGPLYHQERPPAPPGTENRCEEKNNFSTDPSLLLCWEFDFLAGFVHGLL